MSSLQVHPRPTSNHGPAFALALVLLLGLLSACSKTPDEPLRDEPTVSGTTIRFSAKAPALQRLLTAPVTAAHEGTLTLPARLAWDEDHTSRIAPPVAGRITQTTVQAGATVKAGQALAYLASADLGSAQSDAARAQADADQAERNLARTKDLAEAGIVATKDLEQAQSDLKRTRAEARRTSLRLKTLGAGNEVDQRYALRSPIAGVVVERNTNPGMEWRPDQPAAALFVVSDPTYLWCWIDAPESAIGTLRAGQTLRVRASAWPQDAVQAQIDHVADSLDPVSRTLKVRARLRNPLRHLKAEMYVNAEITSQPNGALDIPDKALFLNGDMQQVFLKTGPGQFSRKPVVVSARGAGHAAIKDGLKQGDEVVVDGALYLQLLLDGAKPPAAPDQLAKSR